MSRHKHKWWNWSPHITKCKCGAWRCNKWLVKDSVYTRCHNIGKHPVYGRHGEFQVLRCGKHAPKEQYLFLPPDKSLIFFDIQANEILE